MVVQPTVEHWAAAVVAAGLALFLAPKSTRWKPMWVLSAVFAGAGFLLSGWAGLVTMCVAWSYRIFQPMRAPWQLWATVGGAGFLFAGSAAGLAWLGVLEEGRAVPGPSWVLPVLGASGAAVAGWAWWAGRRAQRLPYRGLGRGVPGGQMFGGRANPDLVTLPEGHRDPKRSFSAGERARKLDDQGGVCAFQNRLREHPRWEPYRSGVQWEADHIVPHASGGATSWNNLQVLCADCNSAKSSRFGADALAAVRRRWQGAGRPGG